MSDLVSVVIPVYNVSKYLDRCLDSVVNQSYKNLEIILVDDGSTDLSPSICEQWAQRDSRICVIHKINSGLGMARNTGLEHATGKYICFFDSDDYIDPRTIEAVIQIAQTHRADIVTFGMTFVDRNGSPAWQRIPVADRACYEGSEIQEHFLPCLFHYEAPESRIKNLILSACSCLFSMDLINRCEWRFVSEREIISEDAYSLLCLYNYVERVAVLSKALYYYCENDASLTRSYRIDRFDRNKHFYIKCLELCEKYEYSEMVRKCCANPFLGNVIGMMKQEALFHNKKEAIKRLRLILNDDLLQSVLQIKKHDYLEPKKQILFWIMRHRYCCLCYALLATRSRVHKK